MFDGYDSASSTDSAPSRASPFPPYQVPLSSSPHPSFLFPPAVQSGRSSSSSTPVPSRSTSPLPQFFPPNTITSSSSASDSDSEPVSPLLRPGRHSWWRDDRRRWWAISRRRRKRDRRWVRTLKRWTRRLVRHPLFPRQPITIVLTLILLSVFAIFLTLLLIYILNPDKEPLPWRAYCSAPQDYLPSSPSSTYPYLNSSGSTLPSFPPANLDTLPPAGVFVGVFSIDSAFERRMLVRTTWASHPRSRDGAGAGDGGAGTSRTIVRFVLGQPRKDWERRINLEMEMYNDIVILPVGENMNGGKTHTFYSWASINAWVPPAYTNSTVPPPQFSYSNYTVSPPPLAPHDSLYAWQDQSLGRSKSWVRPDYVVKMDDDSFVMLAELESRLRLELHAKPLPRHEDIPPHSSVSHIPGEYTYIGNISVTGESSASNSHSQTVAVLDTALSSDPLVYWGYMVTNRFHQFMAGELYALSWSLTEWVAKDPIVKGLTKGAEDKQTSKWMRLHPRASEVRWVSERCWIYDHPRGGTVYSHGFLFPSEVTRVKRSMMTYLDKATRDILNTPTPAVGGNVPTTPAAWAHSSVSTFGVRYVPPMPDLITTHSVESLVEGSDMSIIREGSPMTPEYAWTHREGRKKRYEDKRVGGTVVVHFIKKNMWFLETALALLEGEELSEFEKFQWNEREKAVLEAASIPPQPSPLQRAISKHKRR